VTLDPQEQPDPPAKRAIQDQLVLKAYRAYKAFLVIQVQLDQKAFKVPQAILDQLEQQDPLVKQV
jgi:hypothetical protein